MLTEHDSAKDNDKKRKKMGVVSGPKIPSKASEFELVTNGKLTTDSDWTKGTGWSIGSGKATCDGSQSSDSALTQDIPIIAGQIYKISFSFTRTAGDMDVRLGGNTSGSVAWSIFTAGGTYTFHSPGVAEFTLVADSSNLTFKLNGNSSFAGTVDNVSVTPVESSLVLSLDVANVKSYAGDPVTNMLNNVSIGAMGTNTYVDSVPGGNTNEADSAGRLKNFQKLNNKGLANSNQNSNGKIFLNTVTKRATGDDSAFNNNGGLYMTSTLNLTSGTDDGYVILSFWRYLTEPFTSYGWAQGLDQAYISYRNSSGGSQLHWFSRYYIDGVHAGDDSTGAEATFGANAQLNKWQFVQVMELSKESSGGQTAAVTNFYLYADKNKGGQMYIAELMLEDRNAGTAYAIPYTSSSRSATNGWKDLSGYGNHGTLTNGPLIGMSHYVAGNSLIVGGADVGYDTVPSISFDGSNDYVQVSSDGRANFASKSFTITGWFKLNSSRSNDSVFFSYDHTAHSSPHYSAHFRIGTTNGILFGWNDGSSYEALEKASAVSDNTWHHFAATFRHSKQVVYIDGNEAAVSTHADTVTFYNQEVWIGRGNYGGYFNGKIATAQFYNVALSHNQVKQTYNSQRNRFGK